MCSYHEDVVKEMLAQMDKNPDAVMIDMRLGVLWDRSAHWLWNAFQTVNNKQLLVVKKVSIDIYG